VLSSYGESIIVLTQENRGVSAARNRGIEIAGGHYIAFLDSDDYWLPDKLSRQISVLAEQPGVPVCHTEEIWIRNGVRVNQCKHHRKYGGWVYEKMLPLCGMSPSAIMMEKNIFKVCGLFDENLPACEDYDMWLRITCRYPVAFISEPLIVKTGGHDDQLSRKFIGMDSFRITALVKALTELPLTNSQREATVAMLEKKCRIYAGGCKKYGKLLEAEHILGLKKKYCG
jgi:glycosyltransferase involved in cell wall biosynthesis